MDDDRFKKLALEYIKNRLDGVDFETAAKGLMNEDLKYFQIEFLSSSDFIIDEYPEIFKKSLDGCKTSQYFVQAIQDAWFSRAERAKREIEKLTKIFLEERLPKNCKINVIRADEDDIKKILANENK